MDCDSFNLSRREFLDKLKAAGMAALALGFPRALSAVEGKGSRSTASAQRVILLWMSGGMAHTETFDPKRYTPFEAGLDPAKVLCTFSSIPTSVDGIKFSSGLENLARVMDRGTLIRSYRAADLGFILHTRHQFHWHTGYVPPQTIAVPHMGSVVARELGAINPDVPAFVHIGQRLGLPGAEEIKAYLTAGFLGAEHSPFNIPEPLDARKLVGPPEGFGPDRFESRARFFKKLVESSPESQAASSFHKESMLRSVENAYRLLHSPAAKAFDLESEPREVYDRYNTGRFGLGCLLARRLVEAGARFVEVTSEWVQFDNWDTHKDGHRRTIELKRWIDVPVSQLILDLEQRGLLDSTIVIIASEFSRDLLIEGRAGLEVKEQASVPDRLTEIKHYGLHRHYTGAGSVLLFGGGFKRGHLYGATSDERPCEVVSDEIRIEDLHATIYHALGIASDHSYEVERRPVYVTKDGNGKPRWELMV